MKNVRAAGRAIGVGLLATVLQVTPALAQSPPTTTSDSGAVPDAGPNADIPGSDLIIQALGWLKYGALAAAVAGLLLGAIATGFGHYGTHYGASAAGRRWLLGGLGAAVLAGLAHTIATTLYEAT